MSTCADLREQLIDLATGELEGDARATVEAHTTGCDACAAEVAALAEMLGTVSSVTEIEPTADETAALFAAVDAEIEATKAPIHTHPQFTGGVRGTWERAVWSYENSTRFRRLTLASIGLHAAAAAAVAWLLVGGAQMRPDPNVTIAANPDIPELENQVKQALEDDTGRSTRVTPEELTAGAPHDFVRATPSGVVLPPTISDPPALQSRGERLRAPTVGILIRLRAVLDETDRSTRLSERVGDVAPRADAAVENALAWLAKTRSADGRWGPVPDDDAEDVRDGVTAATVLAFVQNGRSARDGEFADVLSPAVAALEKRLRDGAADRDTKPVYSHALALRALTWAWALDFRHLSIEEREARQTLLADSGRALLEMQRRDGSFGYRADDERGDASCTVFAAGALADLRLAGVLRADDELRRAGAYLTALVDESGVQSYREVGDRKGDLALTAGLLAHARELGVKGDLSPRLDVVRDALDQASSADALLAWSGMQALRRHGDLAPAMTVLLDRQRDDGSWPSATDRHCRLGGDDLTTAMGVLAVTRVYMP